jgi:hypothetical protein
VATQDCFSNQVIIMSIKAIISFAISFPGRRERPSRECGVSIGSGIGTCCLQVWTFWVARRAKTE